MKVGMFMKLIDISCPSCGATLHINENMKSSIKCSYCGKEFMLDDEVKRVEHTIKNAKQAGYEFQKGRIEAEKEEAYWRQKTMELGYDPRYVSNNKNQSVRNHTLLKILLWVLFFPIMLGYKVITSNRFDSETKVFIIVILIGAIIYFMSGGRLWS